MVVGASDGTGDGTAVVGAGLGGDVGEDVGATVGTRLGAGLGGNVGSDVGAVVGTRLGAGARDAVSRCGVGDPLKHRGEMKLSDQTAVVPSIGQHLGHQRFAGRKTSLPVTDHSVSGGIATGQETGTTRRAHSVLAIRACKSHATGDQSIDIGGSDESIA